MSTTAPPGQARRGAPSGPTPFWLRLNSFFAFPFQREPLTYGLLLSLSGLLIGLFMKLELWLAILVVVIGFMLAVSRYAFKVMALASQGCCAPPITRATTTRTGSRCPGSCSPCCWCRAWCWASWGGAAPGCTCC
ncbi:hypothetical protein [Ottowia beijingensis]|uniref:hypothetical protein n=1 Tax=Ottowia beijingensis TaxID=1207057 RepID=UPI00214D2A2F|nr:hypothetical protein [Ottowia beijingensis]